MELLIVIILVVLAGSALFSGAEAALFSIGINESRVLAEKGARGAKNLVLIKERMYRPITVLVVFNNICNIVGSLVVGFVAARVLGNAQIGLISAVFVLLVIFLGEIIPKSIGENHAAAISLATATPLMWLTRLLSPFLWVIGKVTNPFRKNRSPMLEEEIKILTRLGHIEGSIEEGEKDMIHSVFEFSDKLVKEVMVPRPDMITLTADATVRDALLLTIEHGYSRIPVYDKDLNNIEGVLYAKDLARQLHNGNPELPVTEIMREPFVVPETKLLGELLLEFKKRKVHMAVAVDEYGTVVGIVTIEDLLEEIVGDIFDEFDSEFHREAEPVARIREDLYRVDARINIEELGRSIDADLPPDEDVSTVGGLALKALGHLPEPGEEFRYHGITVTVENVLDNRVSSVLVRLEPGQPEDAPRGLPDGRDSG